jgi:outer membrane protein assembly factor BamB
MREMSRAAVATMLAAVCAGAIRLDAQDYPQWRGPDRSGEASGFAAPQSWPEQLTRRWKVEVGEGYATPLVIGNRVYVFTRRGGEEVLTAFEAATGREIWRSGYAAPYTPSSPASAHGAGPKATPAYRDGRIFTVGISGIVSGFDASTGKILWRTDPPAEAPFFSAAASPLVEGDLVFAHPGNYGPLTAFDVRTGAVKWTAGDQGFFASPLAATLGGTRQIVAVTLASVIGVSIADGAILWTHPWPGGEGGTMPIVYGDTVIVGGLNAGVAAFTPVLRSGRWIVEPAWTTKEVTLYISNPVVAGDAIFGLSRRSSGRFFALDAKTGAVLWLGPEREAANSAVAKAGELVFFLNDDAELVIAKSSRSAFEPVKRYTVAESATWAQPAISGRRLFVKDAASLALWTFD